MDSLINSFLLLACIGIMFIGVIVILVFIGTRPPTQAKNPKLADWKIRINDKVKQDEIERRKQQAIAEQQHLLREAAAEASRKRAEDERMQVFGSKFKCHVCGTFAKKLGTEQCGDWDNWYTEDTYKWPGDHQKCRMCELYTCASCLHLGICKTCGEKL